MSLREIDIYSSRRSSADRHLSFFRRSRFFRQFFVKDTKSSSGTFLNHIRLSPPSVESKPFAIKVRCNPFLHWNHQPTSPLEAAVGKDAPLRVSSLTFRLRGLLGRRRDPARSRLPRRNRGDLPMREDEGRARARMAEWSEYVQVSRLSSSLLTGPKGGDLWWSCWKVASMEGKEKWRGLDKDLTRLPFFFAFRVSSSAPTLSSS